MKNLRKLEKKGEEKKLRNKERERKGTLTTEAERKRKRCVKVKPEANLVIDNFT